MILILCLNTPMKIFISLQRWAPEILGMSHTSSKALKTEDTEWAGLLLENDQKGISRYLFETLILNEIE